MKAVRTFPEISVAATKALVRELGYADAVRFLTTLRPGDGDYVKARTALLDESVNSVLASVRRAEARPKSRKRPA